MNDTQTIVEVDDENAFFDVSYFGNKIQKGNCIDIFLNNDTNLANYSDYRIQQRFALATLYYATQGDLWVEEDGWLSYEL